MNQPAIIDIMASRKRGPLAAFARWGLSLLSAGYGAGARFNSFAYDQQWRSSFHVATPVVSVGNLTTGGTGKTPFVAYLARWFRTQGLLPALLSRGYRATNGSNDEGLVLAQQLPGVPHFQGRDRVALAEQAIRDFGAELLILDDGFQHRRLLRDLDIVLIDCLNPWGYGHLLPRGLMREPLSALARADLFVLTRVNQAGPDTIREIENRIADFPAGKNPVHVDFVPRRLLGGLHLPGYPHLGALNNLPVTAFCGIGNPDGFRRTLETLGADIKEFRVFADHYRYRSSDLERLAKTARSLRTRALVTTQKDLVKLPSHVIAGVPVVAIEIGAQIVSGEQILIDRLNRLIEPDPDHRRLAG